MGTYNTQADLPDVESMAHSCVQEALSFGLSHDVINRHMRAVMDKTMAALATAQSAEESVSFHLVLAPNGLEGVAFTDEVDAKYAATGARARGSVGVSTIAEAFREAYEEADEFKTVAVRAHLPAAAS